MGLRGYVCLVFSMTCALFWKCAEDTENRGLVGAVSEDDCDVWRERFSRALSAVRRRFASLIGREKFSGAGLCLKLTPPYIMVLTSCQRLWFGYSFEQS